MNFKHKVYMAGAIIKLSRILILKNTRGPISHSQKRVLHNNPSKQLSLYHF